MHDGMDVTTIIFAVLAVFVVWKLKSVLGTRVDIERRRTPALPPTSRRRPETSSGFLGRPTGSSRRIVSEFLRRAPKRAVPG